MKRYLSFIIIAALIVLSLAVMYFAFLLSPVAPTNETSEQSFSIARGMSFRDISLSLKNQGLVKSAAGFRFASLLAGAAHKLKPGLYDLSPSLSTLQIMRQLVSGPAYDRKILITEGENLYEIDAKLAANGIIEKDSLINFNPGSLAEKYLFLEGIISLEGFLFPDTYRFSFEASTTVVVEKFLSNFEKKAWSLLSRSRRDYYEVLTVASLLEKEVKSFTDRALVAGIIYKRLADPMRLQVDASSLYIKYGGQAYDLYANDGLPPTPIANPGLEAIEAALKPKSSIYWYYLSVPETEQTLFSKTFQEHDDKRAQYLRGFSG